MLVEIMRVMGENVMHLVCLNVAVCAARSYRRCSTALTCKMLSLLSAYIVA